jgi:uncharacterized protein (DUF427 family)
LERSARHIVVWHRGTVLADSTAQWRVLETSHPPVYYLPAEHVHTGFLTPGAGRSFCEFKGYASYVDLVLPDARVPAVAWFYPEPAGPYGELAGAFAFYAGRVDRCWVDGEPAVPQPGGFYGGWITSEIAGPFKGGRGTSDW